MDEKAKAGRNDLSRSFFGTSNNTLTTPKNEKTGMQQTMHSLEEKRIEKRMEIQMNKLHQEIKKIQREQMSIKQGERR